jgi:1-acyl-sn-glycerol-3-phosphate acyltransferase
MLPFYPVLQKYPYWTKKKIINPVLSLLCRALLIVLQIRVIKKGNFSYNPGSSIVANHVTYIDMFLLSSIIPGSFISTVEVKEMPFFGLFAQLAGCIFIDRRTKENIETEKKKMKDHLEQDINMIFFPEAQATEGNEILRFRKPFFAPGASLKKDIVALTVNYTTIDNEEASQKNKNKIYWYRQNPFERHLLSLLKNKHTVVEINSEVISYDKYSKEDQIADYIHSRVIKNFKALPDD